MTILKRSVNFWSHSSHLLIMPKYAVAVGRCTGIYDTYEECKEQVLHFPNAKFKKFDSVQEAQEYLAKHSKSFFPSCSLQNLKIENVNRPELFKLNKISSKDVTLNDIFQKLTHLEERFDQFVLSTTVTLDDLKSRIVILEKNGLQVPHERALKRIKLDKSDDCRIDHSLFLRDEKDVVMVFTDGACVNNGRKGAKAGIGIWFNHAHPLNVSAPLRGPATNNNAEIQAARVALNQATKAGLTKLCVHTDSQFLINCITEWINKWKKNNWKLVSGGDVKNKVELVKLDSALQEMECVEWKYVKGHKGIEGNEMADKLARDGAALYESNVTYSNYSDL